MPVSGFAECHYQTRLQLYDAISVARQSQQKKCLILVQQGELQMLNAARLWQFSLPPFETEEVRTL